MEIDLNITIDKEIFDRVKNAYVSQVIGGTDGHFRQAITKWGARYVAAMRERFVRNSMGGGDWPPLAPSTMYARRHGKGGRYKRGQKAYKAAFLSGGGQFAILRDTGILFAALDPTFQAIGAYSENIEHGIRVGYGGNDTHPTGGARIADIAAYHQEGGGNLPQRKILVEPDDHLVELMASDFELALARELGNV